MQDKDFNGWHELKKTLDGQTKKPPTFNEGEVWNCKIGMNIGYEIYGKHGFFMRPVLIVKKYSKNTFLGLPLTSKLPKNPDKEPYFYPFSFRDRNGGVLLNQSRTMDAKRLFKEIGKVPDPLFQDIVEKFIETLKK